MSDSIENIWKQGFLKDDDLVAPRLNNLYDQKSIHIIDEFKNMFKTNQLAIQIGSVAALIALVILGIPFTGVSLLILLNWLVFIGKKENKALQMIDKSENSYQYLKSFEKWMKNQIATYTKVYTYFYPLLFLSFVIGIGITSIGETIINDVIVAFPDGIVVLGIPLLLLGLIVAATGLLFYFGGALYRLDLDLVFGKVIKKLDDIIADMEELRSE